MVAQLDSLYIKTRPTKTISRLISYTFFEGRPVTTKGRWINPLVFSVFSLAKQLMPVKIVEKPVFIIGTGRSGTTILGVVLSMHKDVGFLNEPKALWHSIYPHEDLVANYSNEQAHYRLSAEDATEETCRIAHQLFNTYLSIVRAQRLVDKYPEQIFRVPFLLKMFPDAKFIFLVRNGESTCKSIDRWCKTFQVKFKDEIHDWWGVNDRKWHLLVEQLVENDPELKPLTATIRNLNSLVERAAVEWILTMKEGIKLLEQYPESIYKVYYEDLASQPESTLKDILDFCELEQDDKFFEYANKTLNYTSTPNELNLSPEIRPVFNKTMLDIGYSLT